MGITNVEVIGEFFREKRLSAGFTLEAVRDYLKLKSVDLIEQYESGETKIALDHIVAFSNIYGIAPDELVKYLYEVGVAESQSDLESKQQVKNSQ